MSTPTTTTTTTTTTRNDSTITDLKNENRFRGRVLIGLDVESVNPTGYKGTISVGLAAIDQETFKVLLKETVFLPFHSSQLENRCKTEFWDSFPEIYNLHVKESLKLGYDINYLTVPSFYTPGTRDWLNMKKQIAVIEEHISNLQKQLEREGDQRIIEFWADDIFDYISVSNLLTDFLNVRPLPERRLLNGGYQAYPRLLCHNSDSQLSCLSPDHISAKIDWVSTDSVFTHLGLTYPENTPIHDHEPSNDALRTIIEVACVYNHFLKQQ